MSDFYRHAPNPSAELMLHLPTGTVFEIVVDTRNAAKLLAFPFESFAARFAYVCAGGREPENIRQFAVIGKGAVLAFVRHRFPCHRV